MKSTLILFFFAGIYMKGQAQMRLPGIIADSMVLQRSMAVPIWGWASPGEKISVKGSWAGASAAGAAVGPDGRWMTKITTPAAGGPYEVAIKGSGAQRSDGQGADDQGSETIVLHGVMIGEVWLCSGQSNMEMPVKGWAGAQVKNAQEEIAAAHYPDIRLFTVKEAVSYTPKDSVAGHWAACTPGSVAPFSATAYFFGRALEQKLKVPIGLISSNWGGTVAEAWTSAGALQGMGDFDQALGKVDSINSHAAQIEEERKRRDSTWQATGVKPKPVLDYNPNTVSVLYNGMIAPLIPFAIRGVIWYQGESNVGRAAQYEKLFPLMIADWRSRWKEGDFPFYYVQIAPFKYKGDGTESAALRDAQRKTLASSNTGMAVTLDIGDSANIHPADKEEAGRRLALWALARTYGGTGTEYSGPLYKGMAVHGHAIVVSFTHTSGGLTAKGGDSGKAGVPDKAEQVSGFEIAGADGRFVAADATIQGDKVIVRNDAVASPVAVRYGWHDTAESSLFNRAGLPASSFSSK